MLYLKRMIMLAFITLVTSTTALAHGSCDSTALHNYMEDMKTDLKSLSFDLRMNNVTEALARIDSISENLRLSRDEQPYIFQEKNLEGEELAERTRDFQESIDTMMEAFAKLKTAVIDQDSKQIKLIMGEVGRQKKRSHRAFQAEC